MVFHFVYLFHLFTIAITVTAANHVGYETIHRIFPAPQVEMYTSGSSTLGIVRPSQLQFKLIGPAETKPLVDAAVIRLQKAIDHKPDFAQEYPENPKGLDLQDIVRVDVY